MSNELYYRGSSTYETAVQNQIARLERSGNFNAMSIQNGLRDFEYGIRSDIRESTYAIVASQKTLARIYQQGFDSINNTLEFGFKMVASGLAAMSEKICNKLDEIHDIVNNPRLTAARELFRRASTNFEKGYYEEALEDCKQAVEKEKTDYLSWYLLGQIYLFGAGKYSNVINLTEAENAFENAAKYIDADINSSEEAKELASQIFYHLSYTKWLLSNDLLLAEKVDESNSKLSEAEKNSAASLHLSQRNLKARYDNAIQLHFLEKDKEALAILKSLIRDEKNYALLATNDKNLETIWNEIEKIILELKDEHILKLKQSTEEISAFLKSIERDLNEELSDLNSKNMNFLDDIENKDYFFVRECVEIGIPELKKEISETILIIENTTTIKECAYNNNKSFHYLIIRKGVTSIGANAFKNSNLKKVIIPSSIETIGESAFEDCESLTDITIENGVREIGDMAFCSCHSLEKIILPRSVREIGYLAFGFTHITSIDIPGSVNTISSFAFNHCDNLKTVRLGDGVQTIKRNAFCNCQALQSIEIPRTVSSIGYEAFKGCKELNYIGSRSRTILQLMKVSQPDSFLNCPKVGCYVATCVYGSYDCPQVWTLRRFRDDILGKTWYGRIFIKTYYAVSPTLVKWFGKTSWFKNMWKPALDKMVSNLQAKGIENTPYEDKVWR